MEEKIISKNTNFYFIKIPRDTGEPLDLNRSPSDFQEILHPKGVYVICDFQIQRFFIWVGKEAKNLSQIQRAKKFAIQTQKEVKRDYGVDTKVEYCPQGKEPKMFIDAYSPLSQQSSSEKTEKEEVSVETAGTEEKVSVETSEMEEETTVHAPLSEEIKEKIDVMLHTHPEPVLPKGVTYDQYVAYCDVHKPFGIDKFGKPFLFQQGENSKVAHRLDMGNRSDWGALRKTGLGWKLNPTFFIACLFFIPPIIIYPLLHYLYIDFETALLALDKELFANLPYLLATVLIVLIIGYCFESFDRLLKPYGEESASFKILWRNELEYLKFESGFFERTYHNNWLKLGAMVFILYISYASYLIISPDFYVRLHPDVPDWFRFVDYIINLGIGLLLFLTCTFLVAVFRGLFILGNLAEDRSKLSISGYRDMISKVVKNITKAYTDNQTIVDLDGVYHFSGKTFYEFQRGNRRIGELLFNIAAYLIAVCLIAGIGLFLVNIFDLLPPAISDGAAIFSGAITIFAILCFGIFILPQLSLHKFLKEFKYSLIDSLSELKSRLEFIYFDGFLHPTNLSQIHPEFTSLEVVKDVLKFIDEIIDEVYGYGTWSYDFPEILKVVVIALSTLIPLGLDFLT